jgi:hypothetical protein
MKTRKTRFTGHASRKEQARNEHKILFGKLEEKTQLGRRQIRWQDIKINLEELCFVDVDYIPLAQYWSQWQDFVKRIMNI